jgi:hypothetical protein
VLKQNLSEQKRKKEKKWRGGNSCDPAACPTRRRLTSTRNKIDFFFLHSAMNATIVVAAIWKSSGLAAQLRTK